MDTVKTKVLTFPVNQLTLKATFESCVPTHQNGSDSKNYHIIHDHVNTELFFILSGYMELITEQGKQSFRNCLLMIPPRYRHFTAVYGRVFTFFLSFPKQAADPFISKLKTKLGGTVGQMPMSAGLLSCVTGLSESLRSGSACAEQRSRAYLELIFSDIFEHFGLLDAQKAEKGKEEAYFSVIEDFVNRHYADGCGLPQLANDLHLSVRQASRVVNALYGESFLAVMNNKRLAIASVLLKNTHKPVSRIASEIGYGNEGRFFTGFKAKYGLTPLQYRKRSQKEQSPPVPPA